MMSPRLNTISTTIIYWAVTLVIITQLVTSQTTWKYLVAGYIIATILLCIGVILMHISWLCPSSNYSWFLLLFFYYNRVKLWWGHNAMVNNIDRCSKDFKQEQHDLLLDIIATNKDTACGKAYKIENIRNREDLKNIIPLTCYCDYKEYVGRILTDEPDVMVPGIPRLIAKTSGTTGTPSHYAIPKKVVTAQLDAVDTWRSNRLRYFPNMWHLGKKLIIMCPSTFGKTDNGTPIGGVSSGMFIYHLNRVIPIVVEGSSPFEIKDVSSVEDAMYTHLLFGLIDTDIICIETTFSSILYQAMKMLEARWGQLVEDIRTGEVNTKLDIQPEVMKKLNARLVANPSRAETVSIECRKGFVGIIKRLWPLCSHVMAVDTGSMQTFATYLKSRHCKGIPFYSSMYNASEGLIASNIWPESDKREYLIIPNGSVFFEFLPVTDGQEEAADTCFADQVEIGMTYELVVTNYSGLYRYRFGDVVRVTRMYYNAPVVEYLYRRGQVINTVNENVTEVGLQRALVAAMKKLGRDDLVNYAATVSSVIDTIEENNNKIPSPFYTLCMEFDGSRKDLPSWEQLLTVDECLQKEVQSYRTAREKRFIPSPIQTVIVQPGSFKKLGDIMTATNAISLNQFKMPRCLTNVEYVKLLLSQRVHVDDCSWHRNGYNHQQ